MSTNNNNKDYPDTVAAVWQRTNSLYPFESMPIDARTFDQLQKVMAKLVIGGKLRIKKLNKKTNDKAPDAYIEYLTPEQVAAERKRYEEYKKSRQQDDVV